MQSLWIRKISACSMRVNRVCQGNIEKFIQFFGTSQILRAWKSGTKKLWMIQKDHKWQCHSWGQVQANKVENWHSSKKKAHYSTKIILPQLFCYFRSKVEPVIQFYTYLFIYKSVMINITSHSRLYSKYCLIFITFLWCGYYFCSHSTEGEPGA